MRTDFMASRRGFLLGLGTTLVAAPAIIRTAGLLMRIRPNLGPYAHLEPWMEIVDLERATAELLANAKPIELDNGPLALEQALTRFNTSVDYADEIYAANPYGILGPITQERLRITNRLAREAIREFRESNKSSQAPRTLHADL